MGDIIKVKNVKKSYSVGGEAVPVLSNIDLTVGDGEFMSLMGPSGSGKSTLLYIMSGLEKADGGSVYIGGKEIGALDDKEESVMRQKHMGFIFQAYNLIENLTVEENILLPAILGGKKHKEAAADLDELIESVGLQERRKHRPVELSGGQQQRTAIARALINRPEIIFADEPTGNLDSQNGREILSLLKSFNQKYGVTILMVTHSDESAAYSDRIVKLIDGRIV
jgi:putative ABC transport system ATP-binding protein